MDNEAIDALEQKVAKMEAREVEMTEQLSAIFAYIKQPPQPSQNQGTLISIQPLETPFQWTWTTERAGGRRRPSCATVVNNLVISEKIAQLVLMFEK
jgi:hypothetical protein